MSIGQDLACRFAHQRGQIRNPRLHGFEGHAASARQQRGRNRPASFLEFLSRGEASCADGGGLLVAVRLHREFG